MIPIDIHLLSRIFRLHVKYKGFGPTTLRFIFFMLPLIVLNYFINQFFFLLDEIFFFSYRKISIDHPIFIVGPPRCGTSLFMDLLNKSNDITSTRLWELLFAPSICQKLFCLQIGKIDRFFGSRLYKLYVKVNKKQMAEFKKIHDTSLLHYEEDAMLFYHSANSPFYLFYFPFRELKTLFLNFDHLTTPAYQTRYMKYYEKCLQKHLYVFGKNKTYLSKNPLFSAYLLTLKRHFKDARFIFMTRTPYNVVPSTISLSTYFKTYKRYTDEESIKASVLEMLQMQYTYPLEILDFEDEKNNIMIQFQDLVDHQKAVVEKVLDRFQISCPEELKQALSERQKRDKKYVSKNNYSLEKYNISESQFKAFFKDILTTFGYEEREYEHHAAQN